jgi:hypothetical protein
MTSGRTGHWTKMHQSLVKFSESEASNHTPSWADFTTTTPELKVSVHTGLLHNNLALCYDATRDAAKIGSCGEVRSAKLTDCLPARRERDELMKEVKLLESDAKMDKWIASLGLQPPN